MKKLAFSIVMLFFLTLCSETFAGWVIKSRNSSPYGGSTTETVWIQDNRMKSSGEGETAIFDMTNQTLTFIDEQAGTYWQVGFKNARETFMQASRGFIDEVLKTIPEAQREMYRGLFGQMEDMYAEIDPEKISSINIRVEQTGKTEEIAGYKADEYHIFVDGALEEKKWLAKGLDISSDLNRKKMMEAMQEFHQQGDGELLYQYTDAYLNLFGKGFEMRSVDAEGEISEVTGVEQKSLSRDMFEVPAGYRKISIEEMMMMEFNRANDEDDDEW